MTGNPHSSPISYENAQSMRPLPLSPTTATQKSKASRQAHLPPKISFIQKSTTSSIKKRRVPSQSIKHTQDREESTGSMSTKRDPLINNCSIAMSRTESVMVSSAGDVIVCRCRRSSTPFLPPKARDTLDAWDKQFPCCDADLLSNIDGPWSPTVVQTASAKKNTRAPTTSTSQLSVATEYSTYEWEKTDNKGKNHILGVQDSKDTSSDTKQNQEPNDLQTEKKLEAPSNDKIESISSVQKEDKSTGTIDSETKEGELPDKIVSDGNKGISDDLILSLPSFDYSHIIDGDNDMIPQTEQKSEEKNCNKSRKSDISFILASAILSESRTEKKKNDDARARNDSQPIQDNEQRFFHGVPLFLSTLSQIRISKVSANPLGAHVLMISQEALLFSYGLNHCGQLGIGFKSEVKDQKRGFHTTPTLITPLLENGGKAINCAAGVDHSLVVVSTGGRRLEKFQLDHEISPSHHCVESFDPSQSPSQKSFERINENNAGNEVDGNNKAHFSEKSVQHHQVYAFGRNNFMKLGLIRPHFNEDHKVGESTEDVVLPRRVGLHCTVWPDEESANDEFLPSQGVFDIAASTDHSSALVRRANGDVEVYMWGNGSLGALGLPLDLNYNDVKGEIARRPTFKKKKISPLPTIVESLCHRRSKDPHSPFATKVSLGPYCSFVVMSDGKCMSFGFSAEGMLGHAYNTKFSMEPFEIFLPPSEGASDSSNRIVSVSAGAYHALALSADGNVHSWGINSNERLGLGAFDYSSIAPEIENSSKENLVVIEWVPQKIDINKKYFSEEGKGKSIRNDDEVNQSRVSLVCAGYDSSFIVTESGKVLSFGKRSGRLGKGELSSNVNTPQPLYGGLRLFHQRNKDEYTGTLKTKAPTRLRYRSVSANALERKEN